MLALIISLLISANIILTPDEYHEAGPQQQQEWCEIIADDINEL